MSWDVYPERNEAASVSEAGLTRTEGKPVLCKKTATVGGVNMHKLLRSAFKDHYGLRGSGIDSGEGTNLHQFAVLPPPPISVGPQGVGVWSPAETPALPSFLWLQTGEHKELLTKDSFAAHTPTLTSPTISLTAPPPSFPVLHSLLPKVMFFPQAITPVTCKVCFYLSTQKLAIIFSRL